MSNIEDDVNELKRLLYSDTLTQYGKRKLVNYYEQRIQELKEERNQTQIISPYYVKENYIPKQVVRAKIEELKNNLKYIGCNSDCSKCFNEEGKALYRGSKFVFCYAYHQIKILQELLEGEK